MSAHGAAGEIGMVQAQGSKAVSLKFLALVFPPRTVVAALAAGLCCDSRRLVRAHRQSRSMAAVVPLHVALLAARGPGVRVHRIEPYLGAHKGGTHVTIETPISTVLL